MEILKVKTEYVDKDSRLVLKRITTDKGEFFNRKIAVSNSIFNCEKNRLIYKKTIFASPFQTFHLRWDKKVNEWDFLGLESAKEHAEKFNRIFIPYKQRNS